MEWHTISRLLVAYTYEANIDILESGTAVTAQSEISEASGNVQGTVQTVLNLIPTINPPPDTTSNVSEAQTTPLAISTAPSNTSALPPGMTPRPSETTVMQPEITSEPSDTSVNPSEVSSETTKGPGVHHSRSGIPVYLFANIKSLNERETELRIASREYPNDRKPRNKLWPGTVLSRRRTIAKHQSPGVKLSPRLSISPGQMLLEWKMGGGKLNPRGLGLEIDELPYHCGAFEHVF